MNSYPEYTRMSDCVEVQDKDGVCGQLIWDEEHPDGMYIPSLTDLFAWNQTAWKLQYDKAPLPYQYVVSYYGGWEGARKISHESLECVMLQLWMLQTHYKRWTGEEWDSIFTEKT